jgi:hypothetical protein
MISREASKVGDATLDLAITLLMFDIFKMYNDNYVDFAIKLGEYWNERVRDNPENFPSLWKKRETKIITR